MNTYIKTLKISSLFLAVAIISGCGVEHIDTKDPQSMGDSMEKVIKGKSKTDLLEFQKGFSSILNYSYAKTHNGMTIKDFNGLDIVAITFYLKNKDTKDAKDLAEIDKLLFSILDGMSFKDVVKSKDLYDKKTLELSGKRP